jgi:hypothetical protein
MKEQINNSEKIQKPIKKRGKRKIIALGIILLTLLIVFIILLYAGFLPLFLQSKEPIGNAEEITIETYLEKNPELAEMPNLDKIETSAFGTDASVNNILDDYKEKLQNEGYSLEYEDTMDLYGKTYEVLGFLKGLTAVGILITSDTSGETNYESEVIYATGNALDFQEILDWYQSNY